MAITLEEFHSLEQEVLAASEKAQAAQTWIARAREQLQRERSKYTAAQVAATENLIADREEKTAALLGRLDQLDAQMLDAWRDYLHAQPGGRINLKRPKGPDVILSEKPLARVPAGAEVWTPKEIVALLLVASTFDVKELRAIGLQEFIVRYGQLSPHVQRLTRDAERIAPPDERELPGMDGERAAAGAAGGFGKL